jgi:hypothetical protein
VARLTSVQTTNTYAKAGLMIRASNAPDALHVILDVRPTGDLEFRTRASAGDVTTFLGTAFQPTPTWLRLTRSKTTVTTEVSADGAAWATIGWTTLAIDSNALGPRRRQRRSQHHQHSDVRQRQRHTRRSPTMTAQLSSRDSVGIS